MKKNQNWKRCSQILVSWKHRLADNHGGFLENEECCEKQVAEVSGGTNEHETEKEDEEDDKDDGIKNNVVNEFQLSSEDQKRMEELDARMEVYRICYKHCWTTARILILGNIGCFSRRIAKGSREAADKWWSV